MNRAMHGAVQVAILLLAYSLVPQVLEAQTAESKQPTLSLSVKTSPGPRKAAWRWTLDERLAARFDPEAMAAREEERQAEQEEARRRYGDLLFEEWAQMTGPEPETEGVDGNKAPELFLPGELLHSLLGRGFSLAVKDRDDLMESRRWIDKRAVALGFGRDLWDRLEMVSAPVLGLLREAARRPEHNTKTNRYEMDEDGFRLCRALAQALEAAKAEFGEEAFLRLLYEAVAPDSHRTYIFGPEPADYQRHAEHLRYREGGCR